MYITNKSLYDRSLEKTPEQLFINSLRKEYELSPAESLGILSGKELFIRRGTKVNRQAAISLCIHGSKTWKEVKRAGEAKGGTSQ